MTMNLSNNFIRWYNNVFHQDPLFQAMSDQAENSPWHREINIGVHTDMVVNEYILRAPIEWDRNYVIGAIACAFHDVGKPAACKKNGIKFKPERGEYLSFGGHEQISARLWEDYAVRNWIELETTFNLTPYDIYSISFLIEYHLPWGVKKEDKLNKIALSAMHVATPDVFTDILRADTFGRISDDYIEKRQKVSDWIDFFLQDIVSRQVATRTAPAFGQPRMVIPIGPSGCGKSTFQDKFNTFEHYSWDKLRHEIYETDDYSEAYALSCDDNQFKNKINARFMEIVKAEKDIYIDNINISKKRRAFFITEARRRGYHVQAILFPVDLTTLMARQASRPDKTIPSVAVHGHYMGLQVPTYGEFDDVIVHDGNLPKG